LKNRNKRFSNAYVLVLPVFVAFFLAYIAPFVDHGIMSRNPEFHFLPSIALITMKFKRLNVWHSGCEEVSHSKNRAIDC
jgi:hypothetical protein